MVQLRPVEEKDQLFIESVYRSTRERELSLTNWAEPQRQAFIVMQSMAQAAAYQKNYPGAMFQIISFNKKDAGRLYVWENENEIRIIDITLLPSFRGKGIGTYILQELIDRSAAVHKKLSLHAEPDNPALKLYQRMGFVYISNNGRHLYMERDPAGFSKPPVSE